MYRALQLSILLAGGVALTGCSYVNKVFDNEGVDYQASESARPMEVPPDLTVPRYDSTFSVENNAAVAGASRAGGGSGVEVLPDTRAVRIVQSGATRYLEVAMPANNLWPRVVHFWESSGASLAKNEPASGLMETGWIEKKHRPDSGGVSGVINKVLGGLTDEGLRDRYVVRFEKAGANASRIYLTHSGAELMVTDTGSHWESRPRNPEAEAQTLNRLKSYLQSGASEVVYKSSGAGAAATDKRPKKFLGFITFGDDEPEEQAAQRRKTSLSGNALQLNRSPQQAWGDTGSAIRNAGFVVDGQDPARGLYAARWQGVKSGGFLSRINVFRSSPGDNLSAGSKYLIRVAAAGSGSAVSVLDERGNPQAGAEAQTVLALIKAQLDR